MAALLDRIVPEDDFPSATQAGCLEFILEFIERDPILSEVYSAGLMVIDQLASPAQFVELGAQEQDLLVARIEGTRFGSTVIRQTIEVYYAGPRSRAAQEMVGFKVTC
jgi:hypothetical protein